MHLSEQKLQMVAGHRKDPDVALKQDIFDDSDWFRPTYWYMLIYRKKGDSYLLFN